MSDPYYDLRAHFEEIEDVTVNSGKGSQGPKLGNRMFAMFYDLALREVASVHAVPVVEGP